MLQLPCDKEAMHGFGFSYGFKRLLPTKVKEVRVALKLVFVKCTVMSWDNYNYLQLQPTKETDQEFIDWKEDKRVL